MGRKPTYTDQPKIKAEICDRISIGETLSSICRTPGMPDRNTVYLWQEQDEEFAGQFARAREIGFDAIAEETIEIAENGENDWMQKNDPENPGYLLNGEHVQRSKLRIETRLKLLAKWSPKRYGDKQQVEYSGKLGLESLVAGEK